MVLVEYKGTIWEWPSCPTADCEWLVCTWADTDLCYKCSLKLVGKEHLDKKYIETHDENGRLI